jgi:RimJ/RimL family protein N-acetyltransferase
MGACKPENAAMRRVFEKLGLRPVPGTWSDGQIYFAVHLDDAYLSENF